MYSIWNRIRIRLHISPMHFHDPWMPFALLFRFADREGELIGMWTGKVRGPIFIHWPVPFLGYSCNPSQIFVLSKWKNASNAMDLCGWRWSASSGSKCCSGRVSIIGIGAPGLPKPCSVNQAQVWVCGHRRRRHNNNKFNIYKLGD